MTNDDEANAFAMALLMPEKFLLADLAVTPVDLESGDGIELLAKKYRVSVPMMTLRIGELLRNRSR